MQWKRFFPEEVFANTQRSRCRTSIVKEILEAAMSAPSAGNEQPWHFVIVNDRKILDEIPKVHPYSQSVKTASVAVVVCGDLKLEVHKDFWVQDCSAAAENILIAVQAKGLGAVWLGIHPITERVKGMQKLLKTTRSRDTARSHSHRVSR